LIHPSAIVDEGAELADGVSIGPFSIIGCDVRIAAGTTIGPHVVIKGPTRIGRDNRIFQFASVGEDPQDKKYRGEVTRLEIGDRNVIREYCTMHRGTIQQQSLSLILAKPKLTGSDIVVRAARIAKIPATTVDSR